MYKKIILFLIICLLNSNLSFGQQMTDEGIQLYWKTMQKAERGEKLSKEDLDKLWSSPGYRSWNNLYGYQDVFFKYYNLVHNPKLQDSLNKEIEKRIDKNVYSIMIKHLVEAKEKKLQLKEFIQNLKSSNIINEAKSHALRYLPKSFKIDNDSILISFTIILPDAHAIVEEEVIIVDVLHAYKQGNNFTKLLGHELHHLYLGKYFSKLKKVNHSRNIPALIYSIHKLRLEGIADLIDKNDLLKKSNKNDYEMEFCKYYKESKKRFEKIDNLIQDIADDESMFDVNGQKISNELPFGGHPNGLYMAHLIEREFGKNGILNCLDNPFIFIKLYNKAAKRFPKAHYVFSDKSIDYLKKLELEWITN